MRIGLVSRQFPPETGLGGGIGSAMSVIASGLASRGHIVHVVSHVGTGRHTSTKREGRLWIHRIRDPEVPLPGFWRLERRLAWWFPIPQLRYALAVERKLSQLIRDERLDVVLSTDWNAETFVVGLWHRLPLVVRISGPAYVQQRYGGNRSPGMWVMGWAQRLLLQRADAIIAVSQSVARESAQAFRLNGKPITVIHTPVDLAMFCPSWSEAEPPVVLYVGRLTRIKGVHILADAISKLAPTLSGCTFRFIGGDFSERGGSMREYVEKRAGGQAKLEFFDRLPREALVAQYQQAGLCVIPSLYEPFANVCLEAMACGKPVIATSGSGFADLITSGINGLLVPPGDCEALGEAIRLLLADPKRRHALGLEARGTAEQMLDPAFQIERFEQVLTRTIVNCTDPGV